MFRGYAREISVSGEGRITLHLHTHVAKEVRFLLFMGGLFVAGRPPTLSRGQGVSINKGEIDRRRWDGVPEISRNEANISERFRTGNKVESVEAV